jgi:hypothetical protein
LATAATAVLVLAAADKFIIRRALRSERDHRIPERAQAPKTVLSVASTVRQLIPITRS